MYKGFKAAMLNILFAAGGAYVVVVVLMYTFQRNFVFYPNDPRPTREQSGATDMDEVHFTTEDGLELFAWSAKPKQAGKPTVVLFHGNAGTLGERAYKARNFMDQGYGVMLVEYRGYAGNPGRPTEQGLYADARAALKDLKKRGVSSRQVVLYGESLGTGVASAMAAELQTQGEPVAALILETPFTSTVDTGAAHYPFLPVGLLMKDRFDSLSRIASINTPLFIVHGEEDETVPFKLGRKLFDAANEPKEGLWLPEATHNDVYDYGAGAAILDFLDRQLSPSTH